LSVLDEAAKLQNADTEFLLGLADLYATYSLQFPDQRDAVRAKALSVLDRVPKSELASSQLRLKLIGTYYVLRATGPIEAIIRDDPANAPASYFLGRIADDEKRWADAADQFKKALLFNPDFEAAYYDLARVQIATNRIDEALATLDRAQRKFGPSFLVETWIGLAYSQQKDYAQAIRHFTYAEAIAQTTNPRPDLSALYFHFGAASERKGDIAQAEQYFEKSLKLSPDYADALNYLGYMWADRGDNLEKARDMISKAVKLEPKNAAILDSMGWVLFKLNQPKEALEYILKAIKLSEEPDATIFDHLGDIYAAQHDMVKAREAWRKSLSAEPNDKVRKKLEAPKAY
jgi:tetratricopeptide (TPR) repeat protein